MSEAIKAVGALQFAADNYDNADEMKQIKAMKVAKKLRLGEVTQPDGSTDFDPALAVTELKKYRWASQNPDQPTADQIKNDAFDRIADLYPASEETAGGPLKWYDRMGVKNLIDEDVNLQKKWLDSRGYKTRINGDTLEVKQPGALSYEPIDPRGNDKMYLDIMDNAWPAVQGVAEGIASGLKIAGAAITGPVGIAAGAAAGGVLAGAGETARQGLGKALGMRDQLDYPLIGKEAAFGAGFGGLFKGVGEGFRTLSEARKAAGLAKSAQRPEAQEIIEAVQDIGAEATPGMLLSDRAARQTEDKLLRFRTNIFPTTRKLKAQGEKIREAVDQTAGNIIDEASMRNFGVPANQLESGIKYTSDMLYDRGNATMKELASIAGDDLGKMPAEIGGEVRDSIIAKLKDKLDESTGYYNAVEEGLKDTSVVPDMNPVVQTLRGMKTQFIGAHDAKIDEWIDLARSVDTVDKLKQFKTYMMDQADKGQINTLTKSLRGAAKEVVSKAHETIDKTYIDHILGAIKELEANPNAYNLAQVEYLSSLSENLHKASKLYRQVNEEVDAIFKRPGVKIVTKTADKKIKDLASTGFEDVYKKVAAGNDLEKAKYLMEKFPEEMKKISRNKISEIYNSALLNQKDANEVLLNYLKKASDSEKKMLLGKNADKIIKEAVGGYNLILNEVKKSEEIGDILLKAYSGAKDKQVRVQAFGDALTQRLSKLSDSEKIMIFGREDAKKLNSLIKTFKYKLDLNNPPETSQALEGFKAQLGKLWNEFKAVREYKNEVLNPKDMGKTTGKISKGILSGKPFGTEETIRGLIPEKKKKENRYYLPKQ